ncbi:alpha/beta hydrolase [Rhodococcus erythropolis]|uniref:Alpha/beta hydrolase family protein n=1 Tax=Rhodococcus erythropolis TaxID=1833 RepID=A0AAX3ZYG6_RHOER|nr:alpha/beta hydrolase family protein [Rhodococcus erythropolis]WMN01896.1 alpha/beta hydrolase family protein [Rhodococcus erythropolis]WMN03182.1 alpha/beta hydrolase family protein [Rhodococcus erythropolis]
MIGKHLTHRWHHGIRLSAALLSITIAVCSATATATATATPLTGHRSPAERLEEVFVPSAMGPVKVQIQWASRGGDAALYLLDGLRARDDVNGWILETDAARQFVDDDITLVMPVGGESSFYTDWLSPSNFNHQAVTYIWETFLTEELPTYLATRGVSRTNNAIVGLSMGGSAALSLAAHHRDQFKAAASYSGYLHLSAPAMREAIRVAVFDAGGFNVDAMWGPPWSSGWLRNDPYVFAPSLAGLPIYISAASGLPGNRDRPNSAGSVAKTAGAMALEVLSLIQTRAFRIRLDALGIPAQFSFPAVGTHSWGYWQDELAKSRPMLLTALDAH